MKLRKIGIVDYNNREINLKRAYSFSLKFESAINIRSIKLHVGTCVHMSAINTKIPVMGIKVGKT